MLMYKYCNNLLPTAFDNMFTTNADNHNYNTRHAFDFEYPIDKLEFGNRSVCYQGVKIWNNILNQVKNSKNLNYFKCSYTFFFHKDSLVSYYKDIAL